MKQMRRIVIDTNCLLAILPTHSLYHQVWADFLEGKLEICVSTEVLFEYEEILSEKSSPYFADIIIKTLINRSNLVRVSPTWHFNLIDVPVYTRSQLLISNRYCHNNSRINWHINKT